MLLLSKVLTVKVSPFYIGGDIESVDIKREIREKSKPKARRKRVEMLEQEIGSLSIMILTIIYLIIVPSVVTVWFVYNRYVVTGENLEKVNVEQADRASAPLGTRTVDQESRDGQVLQTSGAYDQTRRDAQVAQLNQSQLSSIASSVEFPRGRENQQQGKRLKQESKAMPSTSRQASIVAKGLAHECLVGMSVWVRRPAMKEAIRVLLKRPPENDRDNSGWSNNPQFARLNNICLPRIMADSELRSKLLAKSTMTQAHETDVVDIPSQIGATNVTLNDRDDIKLPETAEEVCEEEFRATYMPEDRGSDLVINFISTQAKSRDESYTIEDVGMTFDTVESMIKGCFHNY